MPTAFLLAYVNALPALQAQDNMRQAQVLGVGTGSITKQDRSRILREWSADARGGVAPAKPSEEQKAVMLNQVGIRRG